jgi:glutaredoxin 3
MSAVTIYTKSYCPYCHAAIDLLKKKGASIEQIEITGKKDLAEQMVKRAHGHTSVPQIFIGETHIGGCDDLYVLDEQGGLDKLLST